MAVTWAQALSWRLRRHLLDPVGSGSVADVVDRLGPVPAWPDLTAELATGARRTDGRPGDAAEALATGSVVKVYAFRGATHLVAPQDAGAYLAVRASSRMWELPSWQSFYGLAPSDWPAFREYVRDALAQGPLTHSELVAALGRSRRYRQVSTLLAEGNDTLLKPLTWQGDMALGPVRDDEATFLRLDSVPGWGGIPDLDEAGPTVVAAYVGTHGPTTPERLHDWFGKGLGAKRRDVTRWLARLDDRLATLAVGGESVLMLSEDLDDLMATTPSTAVRLLPGRDPVGDGPRHLRHPRRARRAPRSREPVGERRGRARRGGRHLDRAWRAPRRLLAQGVRPGAADRARPGGRRRRDAAGPPARGGGGDRLSPAGHPAEP